MPGHIWKHIVSFLPIRFASSSFILLDVGCFECWVFADEAGVQQDDVRAQDGLDNFQDARVFGQVHHPRILKVNIVEAVLGVRFTWRDTHTLDLVVEQRTRHGHCELSHHHNHTI